MKAEAVIDLYRGEKPLEKLEFFTGEVYTEHIYKTFSPATGVLHNSLLNFAGNIAAKQPEKRKNISVYRWQRFDRGRSTR